MSALDTPAASFGVPDGQFMRRALRLAQRALGTTAPNPAVGCVIVRQGRTVGEGYTHPGGRPHAEAVALAKAGPAAGGATAYVTLEPCCHHGRGSPCAHALVAAGVARVVVACGFDPDPRVAGKGLDALRAAGVQVETGLLEHEALEINAGFLSRIVRGRPLLTLKLAISLDGRIATGSGESRWLTGVDARHLVHRMRAEHDGVLVGIGTILADDPLLTCRLLGRHDQPRYRIVLDTTLRTPLGARLLQDAVRHPVLLIVANDLSQEATATHAGVPGVTVLPCARSPEGGLDVAVAAQLLGRHGLTRVLVEAGGRLAAALVRCGLVDRLVLHRAPLLLGGDGIPALAAIGVEALEAAPRLRCLSRKIIGQDLIETHEFVERRQTVPLAGAGQLNEAVNRKTINA